MRKGIIGRKTTKTYPKKKKKKQYMERKHPSEEKQNS